MKKDFWHNTNVVVIGAGSWGTVLAHLASLNCSQVRLWLRDEEKVRAINSTRTNPNYVKHLQLKENVKAFSELERAFEPPVHAVIWALPSKVCRSEAKRFAPYFKGDEILLHATKGIEEGTLKRVSEILLEEIPCPRVGVISGPNLAEEVARGQPAATVVASVFDDVIEAGRAILSSERFRVYEGRDVVGVEWSGVLKNVLAIASGGLDAMGLGWNARALLLSRGLAEMVRFGIAMGAQPFTFLGLAGMGDLLATCSSSLSRNYQVGARLAKGDKLLHILREIGSTAEGVRTARSVWEFARDRGIQMPITESVCHLISGEMSLNQAVQFLMAQPLLEEIDL